MKNENSSDQKYKGNIHFEGFYLLKLKLYAASPPITVILQLKLKSDEDKAFSVQGFQGTFVNKEEEELTLIVATWTNKRPTNTIVVSFCSTPLLYCIYFTHCRDHFTQLSHMKQLFLFPFTFRFISLCTAS
jgi:hypothetical protein